MPAVRDSKAQRPIQTPTMERKNNDASSSNIPVNFQVSEVRLKPMGPNHFDMSCSYSSSTVLNNVCSSILEEVELQDGEVASGEMKNKRHSSRIISLFKNVKHRREQQPDNTDYDAKSEVSHKSKSSVRSSISTKSSALKGYLKSFSSRNAKRNIPQGGHSGQLERQHGDNLSTSTASLLVSVRKSPPYRSPSDVSNFKTDESSALCQSFRTEGNSVSTVGSMHMHKSATNQAFVCNYCRRNTHDVNCGMKNCIKFDDTCSMVGSTIKEDSTVVPSRSRKNSADSMTLNCNDCASVVSIESAQTVNTLDSRGRQSNTSRQKKELKLAKTTEFFVFNLPWSDGQPNGVRALYSGPVDEVMKPHGLGSIGVVRGNDELQFHGFWKHGVLVSSLRSKRNFSPANEGNDDNAKISKQQVVPVLHPAAPQNYVSAPKLSTGEPSCSSLKSSINSMDSDPGNSHRKPSNKSLVRQKNTPKYSLGDVARTSRDMIILRSNKEAIQSAAIIQKFEQCFIKRSNGLWTAAILADRGMRPKNARNTRSSSRWYTDDELDDTMDLEPSMLFVINSRGDTKIVQKRHWGKYVRRLNDGSENISTKENVIEEEEEKMIGCRER